MIAFLILTTYFPRLVRGARPSPTLGRRVFQTTALSVLKVPLIKEGTLQLDLARQFTYEKKRYCDHHGRGVILVMLAVVVVIGPLWLFCHCGHGGRCGD